MIRIVNAGLSRYDLPLARPWKTSATATSVRAGFLLWLQDEHGTRAWGDACPLPGHPGGYTASQSALERLVREVLRSKPSVWLDPPDVGPIDSPARHAWSQAILTLSALHERVPLSARLAATLPQRRFRLATRLRVNATIPGAALDETVAMAREALDLGYRTLKLKVGLSRHDLERVTAVRKVAGPKIKLRLDANGAWNETEALRFLKAVAPLDIEYVEQPLPVGRLPQLQQLAMESPVRIAIDESAQNFAQARALLEREAVHYIVIKPMALGGLDRALALMELAREKKVPAVVTDSIESAVGRTAAIHLAALLGVRAPACGLASGLWLKNDVVRRPPRIEDGTVTVPTKPGLGIEVPPLGERA